MRHALSCLAVVLGVLLMGANAHAAPATITYAKGHHLFTVYTRLHPEWFKPQAQWFFMGKPAVPPAKFFTCGKEDALEPGWSVQQVAQWDEAAIAATIQKDIANAFDRAAGSVRISKSSSGTVVFDGNGLSGREVDITKAVALTLEALEKNITAIELPVNETPAQVTVEDGELKAMGIKEVVTIGESVFSGSPVNRRHNIAVGLSKFNGHIIPKDTVFTFGQVLGPVNGTTGYRKELVIQGDTTIPDFGGGLCQVSSTAYRGAWEYGLPIEQRKNHSYAVSYYGPQGTDATVYPPQVDMKFKNDTQGALLMQSFADETDHAYFIYYGTKDERKTDITGPFISNYRGAPKEEKTVYTTDIPAGTKRKAGDRHDGMTAIWYRTLSPATGEIKQERYLSVYQARPFTWQVGVTPEEMRSRTEGTTSDVPSWF